MSLHIHFAVESVVHVQRLWSYARHSFILSNQCGCQTINE